MSTKICFAYPWATYGGCERVFINRAMAFKKYIPGLKVDYLFLSDGGGLEGFKSALKRYGLESVASVVSSFDSSYDYVSLVDCPQLIDKADSIGVRYMVECHTGYVDNRQYLSALPATCRVVGAPSSRFCTVLRKEFPSLYATITELTNFVPWDIDEYHSSKHVVLPGWGRRPILFLGRMDKLKDPLSLLDAFERIEKRRPGDFILLFCGPESSEINISSEVVRRGLSGAVLSLPPIPFHSVPMLLGAVRQARGIFVSPSKEESFGLSASEAISSLIPTALSNIEAHIELINGADNLFCFQLGDVISMADRIEYLLDNYNDTEYELIRIRNSFSARRFIEQWEYLVRDK